MSNNFFQPLENDKPFVKAGFNGFAGSGKTFTASVLAIGLHKMIGSKKPIAVYDTERAFKAIKGEFDAAKIKVVQRKSRSLADLVAAMDACEKGAADILIIDSITHVWESFVEAYKKKRGKSRLTIQDWGFLKPDWKAKFSDRFVTSPIHIIFTGRAGFEYDHVENEDGRITDIVKSGIKMKAETETAYEPDLLFLMERREDLLGETKKVTREITVLKDRFNVIDGKVCINPGFDFFRPCLEVALDGEAKDAMIEENPDTFDELDSKNKVWIERRNVALETIKALYDQMGLGMSKDEKALKVDLLESFFKTKSWTKVENMNVDLLEVGVAKLEAFKSYWLKHLKDCAETGSAVDIKEAYPMIEEVVEMLETPTSEQVEMF